jgi:hypothetical protein
MLADVFDSWFLLYGCSAHSELRLLGNGHRGSDRYRSSLPARFGALFPGRHPSGAVSKTPSGECNAVASPSFGEGDEARRLHPRIRILCAVSKTPTEMAEPRIRSAARARFSSFASGGSVIATSWLRSEFSRRLLYECPVQVRWRGRPACATAPPVTLPDTSSQPAPPARSGAGKESGRR